jgi:spoIIIJ-associated protein
MSTDDLKNLVVALVEPLGILAQNIQVSSGHRTVVALASDNAEPFLQNSGEGLRALNAIARRLVEKKYGEDAANFLIDINGYHERQMETVRANARLLAQRARLFKHEVEMPPMSSYERLVVHELFADDAEIETRSEGEGKFRHIVLAFRGGAKNTL